MPTDPEAHSYFLLSRIPALGGFVVLTDQFHSTPPAKDTVPPVFALFNPVPAMVNSTTVANISTISTAINTPYGFQQIWMNTAVSATSPTLLKEIVPLP